MRIKVLDVNPEDLTEAQAKTLELLKGYRGQTISAKTFMEALGLKVLDSLLSRLEHLEEKGAISGFKQSKLAA